ncbi:MAG: dual specificity protein phosphatase, partial [uncultured bacterium]
GGIGRTGTVVGCWLRSQGFSGDAALVELARLFSVSNAARFSRSPETDEQRDFVKNFVSAENKPSATE